MCLEFDTILSIRGPDAKAGEGTIQITGRDGQTSTIRVEGGEGKLRDVYSMVRFLDRVVAQKRGAAGE